MENKEKKPYYRPSRIRKPKVREDKYFVRDLITNTIISAPSPIPLYEKLGSSRSCVCNLLNGNSKCVKDRYVLQGTETFIMVDYETGEEFECYNPATLFLHLSLPHEPQSGIYSVKYGRMNCVTVGERVFHLKGNRPKWVGPTKLITPSMVVQRESTELQRKIADKLRGRVWAALKSSNAKKSKKTLDLLGCSMEFFIQHIESQFQESMHWGNFGHTYINGERSWNIDHINTCYNHDLTKESEQEKCFHYSNMRPLWQDENMRRPKDGSDIDSVSFDPFN